jgi:DsbC/DsbD-like thiol-disulfide interchange protein
MMISRRAFAAISIALCAAQLAGPARADDASPWVEGLHARVRLLAGGREESGAARLAGIAFELDAGFKTYWRTPGESGLPPTFDWAGSENLASAEVLWPAPTRVEDVGGVAYVYKERVVLPVRVTPRDPASPTQLQLKLDYGICKDICIPATANLRLKLEPEPGAHRAAIDNALARVPKRQPIGAAGDLSILAVELRKGADKASLVVTARAPHDATLFVEGPENWYLAAGALEPEGRFIVEVLERPREPASKIDLRLTLVAGERAIESSASLDTAALPR